MSRPAARSSGLTWGGVLISLAIVAALALAVGLATKVLDINLIPPPDGTEQYE